MIRILLSPSTLGLMAGIIGFLAFVPYILDALSRKTRPNKATWIIWAVLGVIIAASYYSSGARDTAWVPIAYAIGIVIVALLSLRYGTVGWTKLDKICLAGAAVGLLLWAATNDPTLPLYLTIAIDGIGAVPTIKKAYEWPETESRVAWGMFLVANTLNIFAIESWDLAVASYPVYVLVLSIVMILLLCRKKRI